MRPLGLSGACLCRKNSQALFAPFSPDIPYKTAVFASHFSPQSRIDFRTGASANPFFVRRYARRFVPSSAGRCSITLCRNNRSSRSERIFVGIPSGEPAKSLNRERPSIKSRIINNDHRSPKISSAHATGQGDRRCDIWGAHASLRAAVGVPADRFCREPFVFRFDFPVATFKPSHKSHLQSTSNNTCKKQVNCHHVAVDTNLEPKLAAPGAGLPKIELMAARLLFSKRLKKGSREAFIQSFQAEREKVRALLRSCDPAHANKRVLIDRVRGIEDSSRFWSVWMTLEHLRIVHTGIARTITDLANNRIPPGKVATAAVKPNPNVTATVVAEFEKSCDHLITAVAPVPDLKTKLRHEHPWFGPLDAFGWLALSAGHLRIHREQIERIVALLPKSLSPIPA